MTDGNANRIITVSTKARTPSNAYGRQDNKITEGKSNGWSLLYSNGYEGEQFESVQVLDGRRGIRKMLLKPVEACWPPSTTSRKLWGATLCPSGIHSGR